jgi:hypothetical protein
MHQEYDVDSIDLVVGWRTKCKHATRDFSEFSRPSRADEVPK